MTRRRSMRLRLELLGGTAAGILAPGALVIAEHRRKFALEEQYGSLRTVRLLEQGDAALSFFRVPSTAQEQASNGLR